MIEMKQTGELSSAEQLAISALITECIQYEQLELEIPELEEDGQVFFLYEDKKKVLVSILICYPYEDFTDACAFTRPEYRMNHAFSSLMQEALDYYEEPTFRFLPDGCSYDALAVLESIDAEYSGTEHILVRTLSDPISSEEENPELAIEYLNADQLDRLIPIHSQAFELTEEESGEFFAQTAEEQPLALSFSVNGTEIGMCLAIASETNVYLFAFAILPDYQHKGFGTRFLNRFLSSISVNYQTATVQVTEENEAAFSLYRSCGFHSVRELMEYWY